MKYTEIEILEKASIILKDLDKELKSSRSVENAWYLSNYESLDNTNPNLNVWKIAIEDGIFDTTDIITIDDNTGEPIYIQSKHSIALIKKDDKGNYITQ